MKTVLNAPGVPPTAERVADVTRRMLSLDEEPNQHLPASCIALVTKFLTHNPGDFNFILEMGDPNDPGKGGDGYGIVTCMEDECWCDINLTPDPDQHDGGKANGVGSLAAYTDHCMEAAHIKSRNERLKSMDFVLPPPVAPAQPANPFTASMQAGPSRPAALSSSSSTQPASSGSSSGSNILREHSLNIPSAVASSSKDHDLTLIDSDSDDDIEFVGARSPRTRKIAAPNRAVVIDDDSDDDVKPVASSSQASRLQSSQASRASGSQTPRRWIPAWSSMSLSDRRLAINQELRDLSKAPKITTFDSIKKVQRRREQLHDIQNSGCLMQWTPPDATVFQAYPNLYVHPRLVETFERPKPPIGVPPSNPLMPLAGPSTQPMASGMPPNTFMQVANAIRMNNNSVVSPAAVKAVWASMEPRSRTTYIAQELQVLRDALARWTLPALQNLSFVARNRFQELGKALSSPQSHWMPPPVYLLNALPALRVAVHPSLQQFLPAAPNADEDDPHGFGEEYGRPTGTALQDFFQEALANFQEDATVEEGVATLGLQSQHDMLPGANFTLMPHQILGVAFMVKREKEGVARPRGARGGLLCDAMGLGKTVQCIGLMLARNERPEDYERAPQLIVAPLALLVQWKTEIETKTTIGWRVYIHHGQNRIKSPKQIARDYDIVLTTYGTLSSESGITNDKKKKRRLPGSDDNESDYAAAAPKKKGPLFKIDWFRVILDEAHNVRNKRTKVARSVQMLDVYHPWVLTGTPIVNTLADLGPALEFIGLDITDFNEKVVRKEAKQPKLATKRSQAILRPLMIRRNKDTELNGTKILQLPPKNSNMAWQDFELDERAIYAAVEQRARIAVTKFLKAGTLMKNYSVVLVLLTRLRQCVNHPWLLRARPGEEGDLMVDGAAFGADLGECRDDDEAEFGRAVAILGKPAVDILVKKLEERYERLVAEVDASEENQDMECSICYEPFDGTEVITPCGHLYCKPCISNFFVQPVRDAAALSDEQVQAGCRSCPMCRSVLKPGQVFRSVALYRPQEATPEAEEDELEGDVKPDIAEGSSRKGKKRARSLSPGTKFFSKSNDSESESDEKPDKKPKLDKGKGKEKATWAAEDPDVLEDEEQIPPSSKMRQLLELVQGWLDEDPNVKILVFSQFVQFLDLLHDFLGANNIRTVGYRGSMSQDKRDEAIRRFSTPPDIADNIPVMLISTKAGGVGLNLIMANKVIMCDLAWNPAIENQAVDRAHRIGQTKPVQVERLLIRDTVEDRLLAIQERKGLLADGAMGEGDIGRLGRLTLADIRRLFAIDRDDD